MKPSTIGIIVLIGVGLLACIIALIYTKIIKPNTFGYSTKKNNSYLNIANKLNSQSKTYYYHNLNLLLNENESQPIIIEHLIITIQNAFALSNPIEKKVENIEIINNEIKLIYKNNKKLDLPLDTNLLVANAKLLRKKADIKNNMKIIIPLLNSEFDFKKHENIYFVQFNNVLEQIKKIDTQESSFNFQSFNEFIKIYKMKSKPKRTFMNIKFKKEYDNE